MIARLRGIPIALNGEQLVLDVQGVGYELSVSNSVLDKVAMGEELSIVVFTDVKETAISLYGFDTELERQVFLLLKKVKGIGSRIALNMLSSLGAEQMLSIIGSGDLANLTKVPGVGKKTAERLLVELREYVTELTRSTPTAPVVIRRSNGVSAEAVVQGAEGDAILALEKLGFASDRAREAVQAVRVQNISLVDAGELVRHALAQL